jgi:hypothetical protein
MGVKTGVEDEMRRVVAWRVVAFNAAAKSNAYGNYFTQGGGGG